MQQLSGKQQQWSHRASMGFKTLIDLIFSVIGGIKCQYWRPSNSSSHGKCKTVAWNGTIFYHSLATYTTANSVLSHLAMVIYTREHITRAYILSRVCPQGLAFRPDPNDWSGGRMCPREHGHWLYRSLVTASKAEGNLICFIGVIVFCNLPNGYMELECIRLWSGAASDNNCCSLL
jgi:hypothetical protein